MSLKRSHSGGIRTASAARSDSGSKLGRQELYDELKRLAQSAKSSRPSTCHWRIAPVSAGVTLTARLAAEGYLERSTRTPYR